MKMHSKVHTKVHTNVSNIEKVSYSEYPININK